MNGDTVGNAVNAERQWGRKALPPFRRIIDARLALTLRHHEATEFATSNPRDFQGFGFTRVWNPLTRLRD